MGGLRLRTSGIVKPRLPPRETRSGSGRHPVTRLAHERQTTQGFAKPDRAKALGSGDHNTLRRNRVSSYFNGVEVAGSGNRLIANVVRSNKRPAFNVGGGNNLLQRNVGRASNFEAFSVQGDGHRVERNVSLLSEYGFLIKGTGIQIKGNVAIDNRGSGFGIGGSANTISSNSAIGNGHGPFVSGSGVVVYGTGHLVSGNQMLENADDGLAILEGTTDSRVEGNVAVGNDVDLTDGNPACGSNAWSANSFETRNQPCVR